MRRQMNSVSLPAGVSGDAMVSQLTAQFEYNAFT